MRKIIICKRNLIGFFFVNVLLKILNLFYRDICQILTQKKILIFIKLTSQKGKNSIFIFNKIKNLINRKKLNIIKLYSIVVPIKNWFLIPKLCFNITICLFPLIKERMLIDVKGIEREVILVWRIGNKDTWKINYKQ